MLALRHPVHLYFVWVGSYLQGMAGMPFLSAAFLAALFAQAFGFGKTVTGRGFAAVPAVSVNSALQFFDFRCKDGDLGNQCLDQGEHRIWSLIIDGLELLTLYRRSPPGRLLAR